MNIDLEKGNDRLFLSDSAFLNGPVSLTVDGGAGNDLGERDGGFIQGGALILPSVETQIGF